MELAPELQKEAETLRKTAYWEMKLEGNLGYSVKCAMDLGIPFETCMMSISTGFERVIHENQAQA